MTREQWLASIPAKEYVRLLAHNKVEPVGSDAVILQLARVAQSFAGGRIEDVLVLSTNFQQSVREMYEIFRQMTNGNSSES